MSGAPKKLTTKDVFPICEARGLTCQDMDKILSIESIAHPFILKSFKDQQG